MRKICIFTGTRAEYGLLKPLIDEIKTDNTLSLQILVSGMHLSPEFGFTYKYIEADGIQIDEKVEMLMSSDTPAGVCKSVGIGMIGLADALKRLSPDILVLLGDRFEAFCAASTAMFLRIPVAHIHGGEITEGVLDESMRHAITKMSHIHFTSTEIYRKRVIQLGENPDRVFNVGALGVENMSKLNLLSRKSLEDDIGFSLGDQSILVTFHPVTLENETAKDQFQNLLDAICSFPDLKIIFTKANADQDGRIINQMIDEFALKKSINVIAFTSMGQLKYLSAMKNVSAVVGNSSSGIIEAPSAKIPTINIGDRQKGRVKAKSILDCNSSRSEIIKALQKVLKPEFRAFAQSTINPYEKENTSNNIKNILKTFDIKYILKKKFYDILC